MNYGSSFYVSSCSASHVFCRTLCSIKIPSSRFEQFIHTLQESLHNKCLNEKHNFSMANKVKHTILEATTDEEIKSLYPVIRDLRPHITSEQQLLQMARQLIDEEGCHFLYIKDTLEGETEARPVSIITYRILHCLFYGTQMYIHDVVTSPSAKKRGYASALMDYTIEKGRQEKCNVVTLDSGYTRRDAHRFYLNKGFNMTCHHFTLELNPIGKY